MKKQKPSSKTPNMSSENVEQTDLNSSKNNDTEFTTNKMPAPTNGVGHNMKFLIVGIGASAGGIEALKEFFLHVPADSGIAYVVILHLSPDHDSQLAHILQQTAKIPVAQVTEKVHIKPNNVYVVPPNQHLSMEDGHIIVEKNILIEERRAPVDIFFRSLAEAHDSRAVAVILSGTGANGSMGIKRIKERGGATFVQSPREAQFDEMPRNSIATDLIDKILPVAEIPACIITFKNNIGAVEIAPETEQRPQDQQQALREIFTQIRVRTGHDFSNYKRPTLLRRIERRISIFNLPDLPAYATYVQQHPHEAVALMKDLLISVTNFFRDKKAFEFIEQEILPLILKGKTSQAELRIWVAGCATGEEAYSLAMLFAEQLMGVIDAPKLQIFATDIDENAIATAREGLYTINDLADVSPERLRRFFNKEGDAYRVRREVRETILFANHNFIKDPPFSHLDLVSCRNVMIYLNHIAQERVVETFHFALNPGSYLFLGNSESVDGATDLYASYNREYHVFQSRQVSQRSYPIPESVPSMLTQWQNRTNTQEQENKSLERISFSDLHQQLLEQYAAPSLVINEEYNIVHVSERAGKYLQIGGGDISQNLLKLVKPELRLEMRSALYQASQRQLPVDVKGLKVNIQSKTETLNIHIRPVLRQGDNAKGFILVLFESTEEETGNQEIILSSDEPVSKQLEEELIRLKTQLRSSGEQHDFQAEELKAGNEELQAMNEELRSAAEELETSKEELQSINEELRTVNQELKVKIEETSLTSNNLQNLINSTSLATMFLDRSLRVSLFTPAIKEIFNLIIGDYGRPITDITNRLTYDNLVEDAEMVLERLTIIEREVTTTDKHTFMMRLAPYRTMEDRINGVVITFFNITERIKQEEAVKESEERFRSLAIATSDSVYKMSADWKQMDNLAGKNFLADTKNTNRSWVENYIPEPARQMVTATVEKAIQNKTIFELEHQVFNMKGNVAWTYSRAVPKLNEQGNIVEWIGTASDITLRKNAERALRISEDRLQKAIEVETVSVIFFNDEGKVIEANHAFLNMSGYTQEQFDNAELNIKDITPPEWIPAMNKAMEEVLTKGIATPYEKELLRYDGSKWWGLCAKARIKENENVEYVIDVSNRKEAEEALHQSEERYRIALLSANMAAWDWNVTDDTVQWNDQHFYLLGLRPDDKQKYSADFIKSIYADDLAKVKQALQKAVDETGLYQAEFRIVRADDKRVCWMSGYGRSFTKQNGKTTRMVGVMYDITERKKLEQQKEDFIAIASHELKTPVTSIKAYAELLNEMFAESQDSASAHLMSNLNQQVDRLIDLIRALLDTSKIEDGAFRLNSEKFDLSHLVEERVQDLQRLSKEHRIQIVKPKQTFVKADRERIGQVLINLISNAIKYSPSGGDITIKWKQDKQITEISVADTGIGILPEKLAKVFDRFFRIEDVQMKTFPGMGLGLYITANIVHRHGGRIWVESKTGEGSTFYFTIPAL